MMGENLALVYMCILCMLVNKVHCDSRYVACIHENDYFKQHSPMEILRLFDSLDDCIEKCIKFDYTHSAFRVVDKSCGCSRGLIVSEGFTNESMCTEPCSATSSPICGSKDGAWMGVFRAACPDGYWGDSDEHCSQRCSCLGGQPCRMTDGVCPNTTAADPRYIGCINSTGLDSISRGDGNVTDCIRACAEERRPYSQLQKGKCHCLNEYYDYGRDETKCTVPCTTNSEQTCGGENWASIYTTAAARQTFNMRLYAALLLLATCYIAGTWGVSYSWCNYYRWSRYITCWNQQRTARWTCRAAPLYSGRKELPSNYYLIGLRTWHSSWWWVWYRLYPRLRNSWRYWDYYRINPETGVGYHSIYYGSGYNYGNVIKIPHAWCYLYMRRLIDTGYYHYLYVIARAYSSSCRCYYNYWKRIIWVGFLRVY